MFFLSFTFLYKTVNTFSVPNKKKLQSSYDKLGSIFCTLLPYGKGKTFYSHSITQPTFNRATQSSTLPLCVSMAWMCVCVWRNQSTKIEYAFPLDLLITTRRRSPTASCAYLLPQLQTGKPGHKHAWIRVWYFFCWIYYLVYGCQKLDKYLLAFHAGVSFAIPFSFEKWKLGSCN